MSETLSTPVPIAAWERTGRTASRHGRAVVVAGDHETAPTAALALLPFAREVTLVLPAGGAATASTRAVRAAAAALLMRVVVGAVEAVETEGGRVRAVRVATAGGTVRIAADEVVGVADPAPTAAPVEGVSP
jgi:thioredoxin reductase